MRIRDLRWYILASIILILSYAAVAVCYYLPVRAKAENSMSTLSMEATVNARSIIESKLYTIYDNFLIDTEVKDSDGNIIVDITVSQTGNAGKDWGTGDKKIMFTNYQAFAPTDRNHALWGEYRFFIYNANYNGGAGLAGAVDPNSLIADIQFDTFIFSSSGLLYSSNTGATGSMNPIFGGFEFFEQSLDKENKTFEGILNANGGRVVLTAVELLPDTGIYVATMQKITAPYLAIDWIVQDALVFYIMGLVIIAAMLVIFIFGCRKASMLLRVDRYAVTKTNAIVIRVDKKGRVIFTNKTFKLIFGIKKLETIEDFLDVDSKENIMGDIQANRSFECQLQIGDITHYFHLSPLYILSSYYLMGTDITIDYLRRKHLEVMSGKNEITNCDNSFTLTNQYRHILQNNEGMDLAFVEYNIHKYNDVISVFGRSNYNTLLNEFLGILQDTYGRSGIYHLDESRFIVVVPHKDLETVIAKIEESLTTLKKPIQVGRNHIYVTNKIVVYNLTNENFEEISLETIKNKLNLALRNIADFSSKQYIVYEPAMDGVIEAAEEMEQDLIQAIKDNEFKMYLQPQFDIFDNVISGFEALIRWDNPKYKDKSPQAFIELAEQRGYMLDIGRFVIKESFALAKKLEPYGVHVSVNVSPIQLLQVGFVGELIDEYNMAKLKPGSVAIEITETFLMGNFQLITEKLKRLKEMGFHIHLDDFCTGYSSMLYLKDLPVDTIKIDKEFTKYIETSKVHSSIVKTITALGTSLDLDVICEGVENNEQREIMKKFGCRIIQGYLIGKAMPFEDAIVLLDKYNVKVSKKSTKDDKKKEADE